jgi:hypothetical protein
MSRSPREAITYGAMGTKRKEGNAAGGSVSPKALKTAVAEAVGGDTDTLFSLLKKNGGADRGEVNMDLAQAFAREVAKHGNDGDDLIEEMAAVDSVDAPEGSPEEFLTIAGLAGYGERVAQDIGRIEAAKEALERVAQDPRERVHSAADAAVTRMGEGQGPRLLVDHFSTYLKTSSIDSFVLAALARHPWLDTFDSPDAIIEKLDQAFRYLAKAPPLFDKQRTGKRTMRVLQSTPRAIAQRFPEAIVAFLDKWATDTGKRIPPIIAANRG